MVTGASGYGTEHRPMVSTENARALSCLLFRSGEALGDP